MNDLTENHISASSALELLLNKINHILLTASSDLGSMLKHFIAFIPLNSLKTPTKQTCTHFPDEENEAQIS